MSERFVFSTRYLGDKYAFNERKPLKPDGPIDSFIKTRLWRKEDAYNLYLNYKEEIKQYCDDNSIKGFDDEMSESDIQSDFDKMTGSYLYLVPFFKANGHGVMEKELVSCPGKDKKEKLGSRFSFYIPQNAKSNNKVFAVPHLNWSASSDWLQNLIDDDSFGPALNHGDTLYLILHDNDVPNFSNTPFKILSQEEIKGLNLKTNATLNIIVYQHSSNDAVDILVKKLIDNDIVQIKIESLFNNHEKINEIFSKGFKFESDKAQEDFRNAIFSLDADCSVDLFDGGSIGEKNFEKGQLPSKRAYYTFSDTNGVLLTALMHVALTPKSRQANPIRDLLTFLCKPDSADMSKNEIQKCRFPLIIKTCKSFFKKWADSIEEKMKDENKRKELVDVVCNHHNKVALDENLERVFSFFNNSSIFLRLVDFDNDKAEKRAIAEFKYFDNIGLYDYNSAWENLEYNLRIFKENYLESNMDGHANFVTPVVYGNEVKARSILVSNRIPSGKVEEKPAPAETTNWLKRIGNKIMKWWDKIKKSINSNTEKQ